MEETKTNNYGTSFQLHRNVDKRAHKVQMSDHNFQSLADAIQCIAQPTAPLGKYTNTVHDDITTIPKERNHWISERQEKQDSWDSMQQHHGKYLGPLQAKLKSLEDKVQKRVTDIKRLEASVQKNDKILKKHGVAHAY